MAQNELNNDRNTDPIFLGFLIATAVWMAGQLTHDPDSAHQFAEIVMPFVPSMLERR